MPDPDSRPYPEMQSPHASLTGAPLEQFVAHIGGDGRELAVYTYVACIGKGPARMADETVTLTTSVTIPVEVYNVLRFAMESGGAKDPTDDQWWKQRLELPGCTCRPPLKRQPRFMALMREVRNGEEAYRLAEAQAERQATREAGRNRYGAQGSHRLS